MMMKMKKSAKARKNVFEVLYAFYINNKSHESNIKCGIFVM